MASINYPSPPLASEDKTVTDDQGIERLVFAGTPIPPHLQEAYEAAGGTEQETPEEDKPQVASEDKVIDVGNRKVQIYANQVVPGDLLEPYESAGGTLKAMQTEPEEDKMERGPDTAAAEEGEGSIAKASRRRRSSTE